MSTNKVVNRSSSRLYNFQLLRQWKQIPFQNTGGIRKAIRVGINVQLVLILLFLMTGFSLFGQVSDAKIASVANVSSLAECNAKQLEVVFLVGLETTQAFYDYLYVYYEHEKKQKLAKHFETRVAGPKMFWRYTNTTNSELVDLGITRDELNAEVEKIIGKGTMGVMGAVDTQLTGKETKKVCDVFVQEAKDLESVLDKTERNLLEKKEKYINIYNLIPETYQLDALALTTMLGYIKDQESDNWKECIKLYKEQVHRWTLEKQGQQNLLRQQQILEAANSAAGSAKASAIFSGLNFFLK